VGISGELFVALGQGIRAALGDERTCVAALCDGTVGYIPSEDAFAVGGYEPNASLLEPGEGERIVAAAIELASSAPHDAEAPVRRVPTSDAGEAP
jgi:hypothetical protein